MKLTKGQDYSTMLIWAAGLVGMIRYAAAFLASDVGQIVGATSQLITLLLGFSGFAMGILGTFGTTYLFDGWRKKMPASGQHWSSKFTVLTGFVMLAFLAELAILVPFTVSRMEHNSMSEVLGGGVWWWSIAVNIMPMLLLGGVSVGNQIVSVGSGNLPETFQKVSEDDKKDTGNFPNDWRKVRKLLSNEQLAEIAKMTNGEIAYKYGVTERTASNWRNKAQTEQEKVQL
jgi:hypothetical protein